MSEQPHTPLSEQTVCRRIVAGDRCGGDMVRVGMSQAQTINFKPDPDGAWFYETRCDQCGRRFSLPAPPEDTP